MFVTSEIGYIWSKFSKTCRGRCDVTVVEGHTPSENRLTTGNKLVLLGCNEIAYIWSKFGKVYCGKMSLL